MGSNAKQLQRNKYFSVPVASPKDAKGGDQFLKEFVRRMKAGGQSNRKNYSCKDRGWSELPGGARVACGTQQGLSSEPGIESRSQVPKRPACPAQKQDFILIGNSKQIKSALHSGDQIEAILGWWEYRGEE